MLVEKNRNLFRFHVKRELPNTRIVNELWCHNALYLWDTILI